jgi:hypothetical protein
MLARRANFATREWRRLRGYLKMQHDLKGKGSQALPLRSAKRSRRSLSKRVRACCSAISRRKH